ncbi:unnamed protein product, partial [Discosporangium mesarthrocarpum]
MGSGAEVGLVGAGKAGPLALAAGGEQRGGEGERAGAIGSRLNLLELSPPGRGERPGATQGVTSGVIWGEERAAAGGGGGPRGGPEGEQEEESGLFADMAVKGDTAGGGKGA